MIQRVYEQAMKSAFGQRVIVATDDERIASKVREFGGEVFTTPQDIASGSERVAYAAKNFDADIYVNVQGDEPLMPPETIDRTIQPLIENDQIEIGTAACKIKNENELLNPNVVKVVRSITGRALYFSRAPIPYKRDRNDESNRESDLYLKHIGIYAYRKNALERFAALEESMLERTEKLEQLRALENGIYIHVAIVGQDSVSVDTPDDVQKVLEKLK